MKYEKFDKYDKGKYWQAYFEKDKEFYNAIKKHMAVELKKKETIGIDIGAGPGIGARLAFSLNLNTKLVGYEPSATWRDGKKLADEIARAKTAMKYISLNRAIQKIKNPKVPALDYILVLRAAHEIAASLGSKGKFFREMKQVSRGLKEGGVLIVAEPQFKDAKIRSSLLKKVQEYQQQKIGHSHIPSDYIPKEKMKQIFSKIGLRLTKETSMPDKRLNIYLKKQGINRESPIFFYIQTYKKE